MGSDWRSYYQLISLKINFYFSRHVSRKLKLNMFKIKVFFLPSPRIVLSIAVKSIPKSFEQISII